MVVSSGCRTFCFDAKASQMMNISMITAVTELVSQWRISYFILCKHQDNLSIVVACLSGLGSAAGRLGLHL